MKKIQALVAFTLFTTIGVFAQIKNLVVEIQFDPYQSGVYVYQGNYNNKSYWVGPKSNNQSVIYFAKMYGKWSFSNYYGDTNQLQFSFPNDLSSTTDEYPTSGWSNMNVSKEGPGLNYSTSELKESYSDNGKLDGVIFIEHNQFEGKGFAGTVGADLVKTKAIEVERVPSGLTAHAILVNDSVINFYLDGNAVDHAVDTNMTLRFLDVAFSNGGKADSTQNASITIQVNFINRIVVAKSGGDFITIQEGLNNLKNSDVIYIKEGVYTEYNIISPLLIWDFAIIGEGPSKTIIQADTTPYTALGRVFSFERVASLYIDGITIQNGNLETQNSNGGGLNAASSDLTIKNCRILNNRSFSSIGGTAAAGGIYCKSLNMTNCEVVGNICDNGSKEGQLYGGGVALQSFEKSHRVENSTFANNFARTGGGAIGNYMGELEIVNSTLTDNEADANSKILNHGFGGGIWSQGNIVANNSILYNNKGIVGADIYITNAILTTHNSIIGKYENRITDTLINKVGTFSKEDPMLDTLAFNCSVTRTFALLEGSPAIDAADEKYASTSTDQRGYDMLEKRDIGAHESNNIIRFEIKSAGDTLCLDEEVTPITLAGYPSNGIFEGAGVSGNTFDVSKITEEGWVKIIYKFSAPGCENIEVVDSIYAKVCKVNTTQNIELPVRMYPNPVQSELYFDLNSSDLMDIQIMDISGKLVHGVSQVSPKTAVNVADLPIGLYFVKVVSGGRSAHMKFIKN